MALTHRSLALPATPPSVRQARSWVTRVLEEIGRPELVSNAQLAVSELVTNAILHSAPPVTVRVAGTYDRPRIEVSDRSLTPPAPRRENGSGDREGNGTGGGSHGEAVDEDHLATFGRGLALVASHSHTWGSDIDPARSGKTVWFEPAAELSESPDFEGDLFDLDDVLDEAPREHPVRQPRRDGYRLEGTVRVQLCGLPVPLFVALREQYAELRRELRLLALAEAGRYPLATEITAAFLAMEEERRRAVGMETLESAIAAGAQTVDLDYLVPDTAPRTMGRVLGLLDQLHRLYNEDLLLAAAPSAELSALQRWYLGEFVRQGAGEDPRPWVA